MKVTDHGQRRLRRREITEAMCREAIRHPVEMEEQENGYFKFWAYVEAEERYLRVVTLADRETIETAHWDRNYKKRRR
jgi:hypothetical protein